MRYVLQELRDSIAPFASWQIHSLRVVFERYEHLLFTANERLSGSPACQLLLQNADVIRDAITHAEQTQSPVAYNRAATELSWDIETLMRLMS